MSPTPSTTVRAAVSEVATGAVPAATPNAVLSTLCPLAVLGRIHGAIRQAGHPVASNISVEAIFSGGPIERVTVDSGQYELPLLARKCADGPSWLGFTLSAPGISKGVFPTSADVRLDLDVATVPTTAPSSPPPDCIVILGTINGHVHLAGRPAPDGTVVLTTTDAMLGLNQAIATKGGTYTVPSVGVRCVGKATEFFPTRLIVSSTTLTLTPAQEHTIQDIDIAASGSSDT